MEECRARAHQHSEADVGSVIAAAPLNKDWDASLAERCATPFALSPPDTTTRVSSRRRQKQVAYAQVVQESLIDERSDRENDKRLQKGSYGA